MEEKQVKMKLRTAIILAIIIIAVIVAAVVIMVGKVKDSKKGGENQVANSSENVVSNTSENTTNGNSNKSYNGDLDSDNFSFNFLKLENKKENIIYSPLSIKYALKMLNEGASGETKTQIENALGDSSVTKYENIEDTLSLANALYIRDSFSEAVKESYTSTLLNRYNAEIKYDEFKNAKAMNSWIEEKTFGLIKDMLKDDMVQNWQMALINALAIDMEWANSFESDDVYGKDFYLADGTTMKASTMNKETSGKSFSYYKDDEIIALSMDLKKYDDTQLEFVAIMPEEDLYSYSENFDENSLENITDKLINASDTEAGIAISIPKFSFDYDLDLKADLQSLGITDAFDPYGADFSNMVDLSKLGGENIYVGDALHKAVIEFSEDGIKAAAVTIFGLAETTAIIERKEPIEVKIDKPFMFIIRDKETGENWFTGTVYEPTSWEDDKENYEFF